MKITKLNIKKLLNNWYLFKDSDSIDLLDYATPIKRAIASLADDDKIDEQDSVILGWFTMGYNGIEISRLLQMPERTVYSRINRVAGLLVDFLGDSYE